MLPNTRNIARNIGIFGGAQAFSVLAALVRTKVAAVFIGTTGVGLSALYNSIVTFISNLSGLGLSFSGVKYLSEIYASGDEERLKEEVKNLRGLGLLCAIVGALIAIVFSPVWYLSLFVVSTILSGIELAVLKSCQKIRYMALSVIWAATISVVVSIPFYIYKGVDGVIWAVTVSGVCETLATLYFGHKTVSGWYTLPSAISKPLIVLGVAFLGGSIISSGADLAIQEYFSRIVSLSELGLYKAGYQLSIFYTGMIFTAVASDFYPRLSAVNKNKEERNELISRQIKVLLLITVPLVSLFIVLVPYLLPLLYDDTFNPICHMVQIAALSIIVKSITLPLNYLPLALGKSVDYLILEGAFWIMLIPFVIFGYRIGGLTGTGVAIFLCHIIELVYLYLFCKIRYDLFLYRR